MDDLGTTFPQFERSGFALIAMITGGVLFVAGVAPRTERALFIQGGDLVAAKAFSAVVPPLDASRSQIERGLLSGRLGSRSGRSGEGLTNRRPTQLVASNGGAIPGTLTQPFQPVGAGQGGDVAPESGLLPTPTGGQGPGDVVPSVTPPGSPGNPPGSPVLPGPIAGAPAVDPVAPVPEPASWAMMLLGFLAIGGAVRRRSGVLRTKGTCAA